MSYDLQLGNCLDLIPKLPDDYFDVVITSPPAWGSDYDAGARLGWGRLGHEEEFLDYAKHLREIFGVMRPKVKQRGMAWLILPGARDAGGRLQTLQEVVAGGLLGWHLAYRVTWIHLDSDIPKGVPVYGPIRASMPIYGLCADPQRHYWTPGHRMPDWIATHLPKTIPGEPFQPLSNELIAELLAGCLPPGGRVLDPMCGTGTVLSVANVQDAHGVGIDIRPSAIRAARKRIVQTRALYDKVRKAKETAEQN